MNQYNQKNKTNGPRTGPEFKKEMDFYVPVGAILVELKDCSDEATGIEFKQLRNDKINSAIIEQLISSVLGNRRD